MSNILDINNKNFVEMPAFLDGVEVTLGALGGRRFYLKEDASRISLSLREIVKIIEKKCPINPVKCPLSTLAALKKLDQRGTAALNKAALYIRVLTVVRQFFWALFHGNYRPLLTQLKPEFLLTADEQLVLQAFKSSQNPQDAATYLSELAGLKSQPTQHWQSKDYQPLAKKLFDENSEEKIKAIVNLPDSPELIPLKELLNQSLTKKQKQKEAAALAAAEEKKATAQILEVFQFDNAVKKHQDLLEKQKKNMLNTFVDHEWNDMEIPRLWLDLMRLAHFSPEMMTKVCDQLNWDPVTLSNMGNLYRSQINTKPEEFYNYLNFIKENKPAIYPALLSRLFLNETSLAKIPLPKLSKEEYGQMIEGLIPLVAAECKDPALLKEKHSYQSERIEKALLKLLDKRWDMEFTDLEAADFGDKDRMAVINATLKEAMKLLIEASPVNGGRIVSRALRIWDDHAFYAFLRLKNEKENFIKKFIDPIDDACLYLDVLFANVFKEIDAAKKDAFLKSFNKDILDSTTEKFIRAIYAVQNKSWMPAGPEGVGKILNNVIGEMLDCFLKYYLPEELIGPALESYGYKELLADPNKQLLQFDKPYKMIVAIYKSLSVDERKKYFDGYSLEKQGFVQTAKVS